MKKQYFNKRFFIIAAAVCLILLTAAGPFVYRKLSVYIEKKHALEVLAASDYQSVFLSMYDISAFPMEPFAVNKGIPTLKSDYCWKNTAELNTALQNIFSSGNNITNVFLGLDPFALLQSSARSSAFNDWLTFADSNPNTSFEVLFSFPSVDYWLSLSEADRDKALSLYESLAGMLYTRNNIIMYYVGGEDWLICNPSNYTGSFTVNSQVSEKIFLYTFCDGYFEITAENAAEMLAQTRSQILSQTAAPVEYPDLSGYDIVFIGDSILGIDTGSLSFEGIISSLSGASVFNCAQGGTCAAESAPGRLCFPKITSEFLCGQPSAPDAVYGQGILQYASSDHSGKKLCFLINFGLNDYFNSLPLASIADPYDIRCYTGAMRAAIVELQKHFPEALYIIMGPGQIIRFQEGTELINGVNSLYDYSTAASELADELGTAYLDLYHEFPAAGEELADVLLRDGIHYNEHGRLCLSRRIMEFIDKISGGGK